MDSIGEVAKELRGVVEGCRATAVSADRSVTVTAGPGNAIIELELQPRALRVGGQALGAQVVATIGQATRRAAEELSQRSRELTGGRVDVSETLSGLPSPVAVPAAAGVAADGLVADDGPEDVFDGAEKLQQLADDARRQLAAYAAAHEDMAALRATVSSADRGITVTARATGVIESIRISDEQLRHGPGNLARLILATVHAAGAEAARQLSTQVQRITGPALDIEGMVASYLPPGMPERSQGGDRR